LTGQNCTTVHFGKSKMNSNINHTDLPNIILKSFLYGFLSFLKELWFIWITIGIALSIYLLIKVFLRIKIKGWLGELKINLILSLSLDKNIYHILKNVILPTSNGTTTQIDHIIASVYGVFVIETKNMKGWIFGDEYQSEWTQIIFKKKCSFQNPLRQNYKHIKTLSELLKISDNKFHSIIMFTGNCEFKTKMPDNVLINNYTLYIKNKNEMLLTDNEVITIINQINNVRLPTNFKNKKEHITNVKNIIKKKSQIPTHLSIQKNKNSYIKKNSKDKIEYSKPYFKQTKANISINFDTNNIGHILPPNFNILTKKSTGNCCVCNRSVTEYMLEYCLNNHQIFNGKIYCHKHQELIKKTVLNDYG